MLARFVVAEVTEVDIVGIVRMAVVVVAAEDMVAGRMAVVAAEDMVAGRMAVVAAEVAVGMVRKVS